MIMNEYVFGAVQLLLFWGLLAVLFLGIGMWALRLESSVIVRGAGYLLIAANVVLWTATVSTMLMGVGALDGSVFAAA